MLLAKMAFRNLLRNKTRNLISSISIAAAVFVLIVGDGFVEGLDAVVVKSQADTIGGTVLLQPSEYPKDRYPLDKTLRPAPEIIDLLNASDLIESYTMRLFFQARLIVNQSSLRIKVLSYAPNDHETFSRDNMDIKGTWPSSQTTEQWQEVAISSGLAQLMDLQIGSHLTLETKSLKGAYNALRYTVSGIITTHNAALDSQTLWMPNSTAEQLIRAQGAKSHICIDVKGGDLNANQTIKAIQPTLTRHGWTAKTAREEVSELIELNVIRRRAFELISFVLMAISATGIANTIMMAVYERMMEIGTLRALGSSQTEIRTLFVLEGMGMGFLAGSIGVLFGSLLNKYLSVSGISLSRASDQLGEIPFPTQIYTQFSYTQLLIALGFGVLISVLASLWPAHKAVQYEPSEAMRGSS